MIQVKSLSDILGPPDGSVDVPRGDEVLRIPIKAVSIEEQENLGEKYKAPAPPVQARPNPATGKMEFIPNENDPAYLEAVAQTSTSQTRALALAGMRFDVDGEDMEEKWGNLRKKLTIGDLAIILGGILSLSNVGDDKIEEAKNSLVLVPSARADLKSTPNSKLN